MRPQRQGKQDGVPLAHLRRNGGRAARRRMARSPREYGPGPDHVSSGRQGSLCAGVRELCGRDSGICTFFHVSKEYRENVWRRSPDGLKSQTLSVFICRTCPASSWEPGGIFMDSYFSFITSHHLHPATNKSYPLGFFKLLQIHPTFLLVEFKPL